MALKSRLEFSVSVVVFEGRCSAKSSDCASARGESQDGISGAGRLFTVLVSPYFFSGMKSKSLCGHSPPDIRTCNATML